MFLQHEMQVSYVSMAKLLEKIFLICTVFNIESIPEFTLIQHILWMLGKDKKREVFNFSHLKYLIFCRKCKWWGRKESNSLNFFRAVVYKTGFARNGARHYSSKSKINSPLYSKIDVSSSCLEKQGWVLSTNHWLLSIAVQTLIKKLSRLY